jgi:hypothetical protein
LNTSLEAWIPESVKSIPRRNGKMSPLSKHFEVKSSFYGAIFRAESEELMTGPFPEFRLKKCRNVSDFLDINENIGYWKSVLATFCIKICRQAHGN